LSTLTATNYELKKIYIRIDQAQRTANCDHDAILCAHGKNYQTTQKCTVAQSVDNFQTPLYVVTKV